MTTHAEKAAIMYGGPPAAKPKPAAKVVASIYAASKPSQGGSIDSAADTAFSREASRHARDAEKRSRTQTKRTEFTSLAQRAQLDHKDAQELGAVYSEYESTKPATPEGLAQKKNKRWDSPFGFEAIRVAEGSTEKATQKVERVERVLAVAAKIAPTFIHDAIENGAAKDPRFIAIVDDASAKLIANASKA